MSKISTRKEIEVLRAETYLVIAHLFIEPPTDQLLRTINERYSEYDPGDSWIGSWHELASAAQKNNKKKLEDEFHRLFVGVCRGEILPYASWYLSGFLHETPLMSLRAELAGLGISSNTNSCPEPEDHISLICEVMSILIINGEVKQRDFFDKYILSWACEFFADLINSKSSNFYKYVGKFSLKFIEKEQEYLQMQR